MIYYKGIVGHYTIVLIFPDHLGRMAKIYLKGNTKKREKNVKGRDDTSTIPTTIFIYL